MDLTRILNMGEHGHRFNRWTLAKGGRYAEEFHERLSLPAMNLISEQFRKLLPDLHAPECDTRALLLLTLAESFTNLKVDQLQYLKLECSHDEFADQYYRLIEEQILPEICNAGGGRSSAGASSTATN
jgi:hypothetical protein